MNKIIITFMVLFLSSCGTLTSLSNSDEDISSNLKRQKTYCETTTRAYGGVSYNFCKLHSNPNKTHIDWYLGFYIVDTAASAITDTVVLPYTSYQQVEKGSIEIDL